MNHIVCVLAVLASPLTVAADNDDDVKKELKAMEGKWRTVSLEAMGTAFPKGSVPEFTYVAAADGKCVGQFGKEEFKFTMSIDPKKSPKTCENVHESGQDKGKKQYGIYKLEGDKLTVCMTPRGAAETDRPKDFSTKDTKNVVFVFERVKEEKK